MTENWKIGAQLSTSHSSAAALDPSRMRQAVERVLEAINLDCLVIGFRESPEAFRLFCGPNRPVADVFLWFSALSDFEGMDDSDLVVNWNGERSRGWGGWAEKGAEVEETFRFACPNNPAVRHKALRRLRELMGRYAFTGVFLDKIRFPSPANGIDEVLSCFCDHCRREAKAADLDLDAVVKVLADRAIEAPSRSGEGGAEVQSWLEAIAFANPLLSRFLKFRSDSITRLVAELGDEMRSADRKVALDLFSPCLASLVGQNYRSMSGHGSWAKPMTYRIALGPAGLRLEIPALIEGVARLFELEEVAGSGLVRSAIFPPLTGTLVERTREKAVPLRFIEAEIEAAVQRDASGSGLFRTRTGEPARRGRHQAGGCPGDGPAPAARPTRPGSSSRGI